MSQSTLFWTAAASLVATSLTAISSRALREFSRTDLQEICRRRDRLDRFGEILRQHETTALGIDLLGAFAVALFAIATFAWTLGRYDQELALFAVAAVVGLTLAMLRVAAAWAFSRVFAEPFLFHTWPVWRAMGSLSAPLRAAVRLLDAILHRLAGRDPSVPDEETIGEEIRTIVTEGHREGLLEEDAREMIEGVIELGDADVSEIMTPRTEMHMVHVDQTWDGLLADVIRMGHTRIPAYEDSRDDIVGVIYVKDLIPELAKDDPANRRTVRELVRKPLFVPQTKAVDDLLEMFQQERTHIALVLDEYGGVAGLVTIEDVLEEIVGEIVDEYDDEVEDEIRSVGDGVCEAIGRTHVDEINSRLGLELPEDGDFDTIGGFVFSQLGRVPRQGEEVVHNGSVRVTVLEVSERRVERVLVERIETATAESA
ncbi:Magnesium and cobalt efflux protein CorC [Botrimarina colliarenosi]|uniref:Magnesium and cobalt efflux protein CorC n=1 Tax=Botrimarina colliarenosi TaxID=2528001 RepID=A0A5C6ABD4_9BACT|nr:hemolysin family protein [Botrimarina colliarenosi]TWT96598.1 Magnesium and cobalt efflux protein CorC [Botrimarina colliarenosi]